MPKEDGGYAFPCAWNTAQERNGMSLRDWLAGLAMQAILAARLGADDAARAESAYRQADALLAERRKG